MNIMVWHFRPTHCERSIMPVNIFLNYLEKNFNVKIVDSKNDKFEIYRQIISKFSSDILIIPYAYGFVAKIDKKAEFVKSLLEKGVKIVRFFCEYNLSENGSLYSLRDRFYYLTNFEPFGYYLKAHQEGRYHYTNVNCLAYNEIKRLYKKEFDLIYYGSFRRTREKYFKKYLDNDFIYISTSKKNFHQYKSICPNVKRFLVPLDIRNPFNPELSKFKYSLYIEDEFTHKVYNFPANRFYEALSNRVVQLFDVNCLNTFNRYGIDISDFIVEDFESLKRKVETLDYEKAWEYQSQWINNAKEDKEKLEKDLKNIFEKIYEHKLEEIKDG